MLYLHPSSKVDPKLWLKLKPNIMYPGDVAHGGSNGIEIGNGGHIIGEGGGYNLILQEVWFVTMISVIVILVIIIFSAIVCIRRRKNLLKSTLGHYNGKSN